VTSLRPRRIFWMGAAAIVVAAALVALAAVVKGDFSDTDGRILGTLAAALLAGSTLAAGLALVERGGTRLGWCAVAVSGPGFALLAYSIWDFVFDGGSDSWRWGWTGALVLLASLIAVTAQLLARRPAIVRLAWLAGGLSALASGVSIAAIWRDSPGDTIGKTLAVLWILAGLAFLLVPVLQRFSAAGIPASSERALGELDGIELVATHVREGTIDARLEPGERLVLRHRPGAGRWGLTPAKRAAPSRRRRSRRACATCRRRACSRSARSGRARSRCPPAARIRFPLRRSRERGPRPCKARLFGL